MRRILPSYLLVAIAAATLPKPYRTNLRTLWFEDLDGRAWLQRLPYALERLWTIDEIRVALTRDEQPPAIGRAQATLLMTAVATSLAVVAVTLPVWVPTSGELPTSSPLGPGSTLDPVFSPAQVARPHPLASFGVAFDSSVATLHEATPNPSALSEGPLAFDGTLAAALDRFLASDVASNSDSAFTSAGGIAGSSTLGRYPLSEFAVPIDRASLLALIDQSTARDMGPAVAGYTLQLNGRRLVVVDLPTHDEPPLPLDWELTVPPIDPFVPFESIPLNP